MRIIQLLRNISYGDAIGNDVLAIRDALKKMGYRTEIYAEFIDQSLPKGTAYSVNRLASIAPDDVVIYHLSTGTDLNYAFAELNCRKIVRYHNITPPEFFKGYSYEAEKSCEEGLKAARAIAGRVDYCLADSEFNKEDLIQLGYKQKIDVLPILIPFSDYDKSPNSEVLRKYSDGGTNLLFTGRVVPNKKHEDIIRLFYYYKNYIDGNARLFLVGGYAESDRYYQKLKKYIKELELSDVIFPGHIPFSQILSYYRLVDLYVCMSEHEGFCVPLVEAMYFRKPILAYSSTAVPETLGGGGVLVKEKNPKVDALLAERVIKDNGLQNQILENQQERIQDFSYKNVFALLKKYMVEFLGGDL